MRVLRVVVVGMGLIAASAHGVPAFDLTGTWTGTESCTTFNGGKVKHKNVITVSISQSGNDLNVEMIGSINGPYFNGTAIADALRPLKGGGSLVLCGSNSEDNGFGEIVRLKATTNDEGGGKLKGFATGYALNIVEDCKYSLTRTHLANPNVAACAP